MLVEIYSENANNGKGVREIAEYFRLKKKQIKNWIYRFNRKPTKLEAGIKPKPKERIR